MRLHSKASYEIHTLPNVSCSLISSISLNIIVFWIIFPNQSKHPLIIGVAEASQINMWNSSSNLCKLFFPYFGSEWCTILDGQALRLWQPLGMAMGRISMETRPAPLLQGASLVRVSRVRIGYGPFSSEAHRQIYLAWTKIEFHRWVTPFDNFQAIGSTRA